MKKSVLVTGYDGFVGSNLIENASEYNLTKVCLIKNKYEDVNFEGIDVVIHLAALVHQMKGAPVEDYFRINSNLALNVAKRAKKQGVKQFIFMSTVKVYGESTETGKPWNEESICKPLDPYGESKLDAEKKIRQIEDGKFKLSIIRTSVVYGQGVKGNIIKLIKLVDKWPFLPFGGINNKRSMISIENLIALIKRLIEKEASGVFVASDGAAISSSELVNHISNNFDKKIRIFTIPKFIINIIKLIKPNIIKRLFGNLELDSSASYKRIDFIPPLKVEDGI